jgi:UDPglucose 6-dehydrogenase
MKIGIIGLGAVGSAVARGFEYIGHTVIGYDKKDRNSSIDKVIETDIIYICVGTPSDKDGRCDLSAVYNVCSSLEQLEYNGIVVIKSTSEPGTTASLQKEINLTLAYVPEFLRERCAFEDFIYNHEILVVGTEDKNVFDKIVESHGYLPKDTLQVSVTEAELIKYYCNTYKAMKVVFANAFYEIAQKLDADYNAVRSGFLKHIITQQDYTKVDKSFRGYGGMCLPKDTSAMHALCEKLNLDIEIFGTIDSDNKLYKTTVPKGMRE